jgi:iron complex transport system ATP-binding protein
MQRWVHTALDGLTVAIDAEAVHVHSERPLATLASAVVGGGSATATDILNVHVRDDYDCDRPAADLAAFAAARGVGGRFIGLMTAAETQYACAQTEAAGDLRVAAVVSMGLSNVAAAGVTPPAPPAPGTINAVVVVDGALSPAAMVNAVITVTEAKALVLAAWDVRTPDGEPVAGTSTDSVVIACTGSGPELDYAGSATTVGHLMARAVRKAMDRICRDKCARDGGRSGW